MLRIERAFYIWEYLVKMKRDESCERGMKPKFEMVKTI